jgi:hypothetical protein
MWMASTAGYTIYSDSARTKSITVKNYFSINSIKQRQSSKADGNFKMEYISQQSIHMVFWLFFDTPA